jgi:hypothetical protein
VDSVLVSEEDFINSFDSRQVNYAQKYMQAKEIFQSIKNMSEVSRQVKMPKRTVIEWLSGAKKPICIKQMNALKTMGLMPLVESGNKDFILFLGIFAFIFGDGHLCNSLGSMRLSGCKNDLRLLKQKIESLWGVNCGFEKEVCASTVTKIMRDGKVITKKIQGLSYVVSINSSSLSRLVFVAGAPKGDKVKQKVFIPKWLMDSDISTKRLFLGVLFGNELQIPSLRAKNAFTSVHLGFHKVDNLTNNLHVFLRQIKSLLKEFEVFVSDVKIEDTKCLKKGGLISFKSFIFFKSNPANVLNLFLKIPILYAGKKSIKFEKCVKSFLEEFPIFEKDWLIYEKAIELHKQGLGHVRIFNKLGLPKNYLYKLNAWIYYDLKPKYYSERSQILLANAVIKKGARGML